MVRLIIVLCRITHSQLKTLGSIGYKPQRTRYYHGCNGEYVKNLYELLVMLMWHSMMYIPVRTNLWHSLWLPRPCGPNIPKLKVGCKWGKQIKSLLKDNERKYNSILHEESLWYEDSILYQWMPHGVLGSSSAKSNFNIFYHG